jgi:hypothetical protein
MTRKKKKRTKIELDSYEIYLTNKKNKAIDVNKCKINTSDSQTIPIIDKKIKFYPCHSIICPNSPFFKETPINRHRKDNKDS